MISYTLSDTDKMIYQDDFNKGKKFYHNKEILTQTKLKGNIRLLVNIDTCQIFT